MSDQYNFIYNELVRDHDDVAGIVAYSVYKRQKIEFLKGEEGGDNVQVFKDLSNSPAQLEFYKSEASEILQAFAQTYLEEDLAEREAYFNDKLEAEIKEIKPKFMMGVYQSILGSYGFLLSFGLLFFIIWASKVGIKELL